MRARILGFVNALRDAGVACSVSETLDATRAVATLGVERPVLREALAATLVKDHGSRPTFDDVFDRYFALPARGRAKRRPRQEDGGDGSGGAGEGRGRRAPAPGTRAGDVQRHEHERGPEPDKTAVQLANRRALMAKPFETMDGHDVEELRDLAATLGRRFRTRWSRRVRRANFGRVDMRRTIRRATTRGGVPLELLYRRARPGKSDLVALVDLSYSTATAAAFLLSLLTPAQRFFRRVLHLGYVDAITELSFEHGHVIPQRPLDLHARSDFGRVLLQISERHAAHIGRNSVLLILGDARNNRRPPRADVLARLQQQVRAVVWLNPERRERWDSGDSVMSTYARHCTRLVNAWNAQTLMAALDELARAAR